MGYRNYIGILPKEQFDELAACKTIHEKKSVYDKYNWKYDDDDDEIYLPAYKIGYKNIYELGKYFNESPFYSLLKEVYDKDSELYDHDGEFMYGGDDAFKQLIDCYRTHIVNYFSDLMKAAPDDEYFDFGSVSYYKLSENEKYKWRESRVLNALDYKVQTWSKFVPYNMRKGNEKVISSFEYEYAIFELVRMYKLFDPEKDVLIFYGY